MISDKMAELVSGNSVIRAMFEEGNRLAAEFGRENVYDFSLGNPNFPPPASVKIAIAGILDAVSPDTVHGYMSNAGFPSVRGAVADSLNARFGTAFSGDNIVMSCGAAGGMNAILKTLLNQGDEVVAFAPYFVEYGNYVGNFGGSLVVVPPNPPGFQPDPAALAAAVTEKTKAVIINTPNNPTGVVYSENTLGAIAAVLEEKQKEYRRPIYVISDEPYRELVYDDAYAPFISGIYRNSIICYSWSKSLSLPGERIGYLAVPPEADGSELITQAAVIATRILGFVNAPSLMQLAVERCLNESVDVAAYDANRRAIYSGLTELGFECVFPKGAFYLWVKTPGDDREFAEAAKKHNILLVPGTSFACPGYARVAYCVSAEMIQRSLPAFGKLAAECGL
jgi:aspartate aminotransferase